MPPTPSLSKLPSVPAGTRTLPWTIGKSQVSEQAPPIPSRVLRARNVPLVQPNALLSPLPPLSPSTPKRRRRPASSKKATPAKSPAPEPISPSPYIFDDDFYNNRDIYHNGGVTPNEATVGATTNKQRKHLRIIHEDIIHAAQVESGFIPLEMPNPARKLQFLTPPGVTIAEPASFFRMFFKEEDYEIMAQNTNRYAIYLRARESVKISWYATSAQEVKEFIAIWIYLGMQRTRHPEDCWALPITHSSPCRLVNFNRYSSLMKYFKVSSIDDDQDLSIEDWHRKLSPLDENLQERFQSVVIHGSRVSYDEQMLPFQGRSQHVTVVPGKPDPNGFKLWTLGEDRYCFDWLYYSGNPKIGTRDIQDVLADHPLLTPTTASVLTLALNIQKNNPNAPFTIFMDNLFTIYNLFSTLQGYSIGAVGTIRANYMQGRFTEELMDKNNGKLMTWGEICTEIVQIDGGQSVLFVI